MDLRLNPDDSTYLELLLKAIQCRDWRSLEQAIRTNPKKFIFVAKELEHCDGLNGMTILHACIRYDPPPRVVQMIIRLCPSCPRGVDCLNRTPLHVAAAIRANPQSIGVLLDAYREGAAIQDIDGKTPLHFACDNSCELFEDEVGIIRPPSSINVIRVLALAARNSVVLEDLDGTSALEYAILSDFDVFTVKFLMRITQMQLCQESNNTKNSEETASNLDFILMQSRRHEHPVHTDCTERTFSPFKAINSLAP